MKKLIYTLIVLLIAPIICAQELIIDEKKEFPLQPEYVREAEFSPFRNFFAVAIGNNTLELYDRNWELIFSHQGNSESFGGIVSFSPDERFLAYGRYKGGNDIAIIRLSDLKVIQILRGHSSWINDLEFSNSGDFLVSASSDETIVIWRWTGGEFGKSAGFDHYEGSVTSVSFSMDDKYLISGDQNRMIMIYEAGRDGYKLADQLTNGRGYVETALFHPERIEFLTGSSNGLRRYRNNGKGFEPVDSVMQNMYIRNQMHFSPDGKYVSIPTGNTLEIWRVGEKEISEADGIYRHNENVFGGTFSDDGQFMTSYGADKRLIIWEISPIGPSRRSMISSWVDDNLTPAQRKILTYEVVSELVTRVDENMRSPRGEFETSNDFNNRREALKDWTLALIQRRMEDHYKIRELDNTTFSVPVQAIIGYNADKAIYKIRFIETEAGAEIPIREAKILKEKWENASIRVSKESTAGKRSNSYANFRLIIPGTDGSFPVTPVENPFHIETSTRKGVEPVYYSQIPDPILSQDDSDAGVITHALMFATNVYDSFSELVNPVLDASTIASELSENYGVKTEVVTNPTLTQTVEKIREYASRKYNEDENLIIFFAGHGEYDEIFKEGYVISRDSRADDISKTSYLSHSNLRTMVNNINCKHIFLVMDVCFGGTIDPYLASSSHRGSMEMYADIPKEEFIDRKLKYKTRLYLTSGGKEYVPDGRQGFHSPFARRFIEALRKYGGEDGILTTSEILQYVEKVNPQPRFGEFGDNEPGSDFILVAK